MKTTPILVLIVLRLGLLRAEGIAGQSTATVKGTVTHSATGEAAICDGETVLLSSSGGETYTGYLNGVQIADADGQQFEAVASGAYVVEVTNADACDGVGESEPVFVVVNPQPTANATFNLDPGSLEVQFINNSTLATDYLWDFGDGTTSAEANPLHTFDAAGNYEVTLTASNGDCEDVFTLSVTGVRVEEMWQQARWSLYRNPASEQLMVGFDGVVSQYWTLSIIDAGGGAIITTAAAGNQLVVPVSGMAAGLYTAVIMPGSGQLLQFRFAVNH
jgi:PKD repeat protein